MSDPPAEHGRAVAALQRRLRNAGLPGVERVVLFGSVARNEHGADSDVDVLAILDDDDPEDAAERVRDVAYDAMLETGTAISVQAVRADRFADRADHPFFGRVRAEGTTVYP